MFFFSSRTSDYVRPASLQPSFSSSYMCIIRPMPSTELGKAGSFPMIADHRQDIMDNRSEFRYHISMNRVLIGGNRAGVVRRIQRRRKLSRSGSATPGTLFCFSRERSYHAALGRGDSRAAL